MQMCASTNGRSDHNLTSDLAWGSDKLQPVGYHPECEGAHRSAESQGPCNSQGDCDANGGTQCAAAQPLCSSQPLEQPVRQVASEALQRTPSMEWTLEELFRDVDANGDGQISKEEFRKAFTGRRKVRLREKLAVASALGEGSEDDDVWKEVFQRMDNNCSEALTLEEFMGAAIHGLGACMD
eukprot:TRINITY_DN7481_c0_g1_i1.p1 TRINITY_DN7481_c0_g1~~TRINITY_DN7481_c0_g1_i1.p1  ORF type:complete len:182 (-),score=40.13 TRINITY_DN7481_c0_g1_i1:251-796(-)